ncbi:hypothetical protein [Nitrospina gracilis]|uniref:hypothetical protein n=1 Tax=Nitrospina gracilis TaxID=35801 RepID=UPI001F2E3CFA|nr:hypothetical protein [Nitrospina gracilis]MCF8721403.1 hypothetical protein [Nitrospina gracilis Nb-211]
MKHDRSLGDPVTGRGYRSKITWQLGEWPRQNKLWVIDGEGNKVQVALTRELMSAHPKLASYIESVIIRRRIHDYF